MFPFWVDLANTLWLPWWTAALIGLASTMPFLCGR
jgi:hypothetical protein